MSEISKNAEVISRINEAIGRSVIGQDQLRNRLLLALIAGGHLLIEGVPGLAKTLSIKALATAVDGGFSRIQFTPDLLPSDIVGSEIYRPKDHSFEVRKGPVFTNFLLADEINRAPAKVQSALLETMQEKQVTIGEQTLAVPRPFFVLATQNPLEQEGTYPLPEAQVDRFLMKVQVDYPSEEEELKMLREIDARGSLEVNSGTPAVASLSDIENLQSAASDIFVDAKIHEYIVQLVNASRNPKEANIKGAEYIDIGVSPRAGISLLLCSRAAAVMQGVDYVVPEMIKDVLPDIFRHRLALSYEAEVQGVKVDDIIESILSGVEVP
ncbi:UNVERIFIED_CONTAM: hypothetical protein GTU68_044752 [Idotea baltica]|nr:hypothetical protein [Idotea baltica]